jgi:hypothetical protein
MQQKYSNQPSGGSPMVEPFSHYPRIVGSNPAAGIGGEKMMKKLYLMKVTELVYVAKRVLIQKG